MDRTRVVLTDILRPDPSHECSRVERIKTDYNELRKQYDRVKQAQQSQVGF